MNEVESPGQKTAATPAQGAVTELLAAQAVMQTLLKSVDKTLHRLSGGGESDQMPKMVHQLRVATRRADAAIRLLGAAAKKTKRKRLRVQLRTIRDGASKLRKCVDRDSLLQQLRVNLMQEHLLAAESAAVLCDHEAAFAQATLIDLVDRFAFGKFAKTADGFLRSWERRAKGPLGTDAAPNGLDQLRVRMLPAILEQMRDVISEPLDKSFDALHQVRLHGKKVRYGLEVFDGALDQDTVHEAREAPADLQDKLGVINDGRELEERLQGYSHEVNRVIIGKLKSGADESTTDITGAAQPTSGIAAALASLAEWIGRRNEQRRDQVLNEWQHGTCSRLDSLLETSCTKSKSRPPKGQ